MKKYQVHPAADVWPMLPKDEMQQLADDIKANGQIFPILIKDGVIIDGRNRLAACESANVEPVFEEFSGEDVESYILSANNNRRNLNKGQRAMCVAMMFPEKRQGKKGTSLILKEVNGSYLSQARTVLSHSKDLADAVIGGIRTLSSAYEEASAQAAKTKGRQQRFEQLRNEYSDLADQVEEGTLSIEDAWAVRSSRQEENRKRIASLNESIQRIEEAANRLSTESLINNMANFIRNESKEVKSSIKPKVLISNLIAQLGKLQGAIDEKAE